MIFGHVEFLNVKGGVVFGSVKISSWSLAAAQNVRRNSKVENFRNCPPCPQGAVKNDWSRCESRTWRNVCGAVML